MVADVGTLGFRLNNAAFEPQHEVNTTVTFYHLLQSARILHIGTLKKKSSSVVYTKKTDLLCPSKVPDDSPQFV